jgi:quinol monooxygenase YgiN|uniref:putative quinol monooxygenase n=1 Tax=Sinorhizobium/Ensifer group TaxID=227292 RepID=UPI0002861AC9|nr:MULTISPECIES: putative quinol monooxygenase [Sinorhizobium/Ensifer group]ASP82976.1 antibiotic biosynthesis monooxygenase [Sinorhizobium meliloti]MQV19718.1 antibiotic biosynthesis monooxygenase [Sinorhizobium meliloti]MQV33098.1 antibiotic biosynthesis monooxygenase [Sinorhizobium meliloti]MQW18145.1 antibiotic biosynthesis monooxygenase [Sinorhizobium meliloti]RVE79412.1 antibiotic biosynthesis monooxygenase [Sinorhizobium meliloti]
MKEKLVVIATVVAHPGKEEQLREGLLGLVSFAKTEPGFVQYDLHVSLERPGEFVFYEIWEDEQSLDVHNNTESMKAFGAKAGQWIQSVTLNKYKRIS